MSIAAQTRAAGFYWVRERGDWAESVWSVAGWRVDGDGAYWTLHGRAKGYGDHHFTEIDERPIERQP